MALFQKSTTIIGCALIPHSCRYKRDMNNRYVSNSYITRKARSPTWQSSPACFAFSAARSPPANSSKASWETEATSNHANVETSGIFSDTSSIFTGKLSSKTVECRTSASAASHPIFVFILMPCKLVATAVQDENRSSVSADPVPVRHAKCSTCDAAHVAQVCMHGVNVLRA